MKRTSTWFTQAACTKGLSWLCGFLIVSVSSNIAFAQVATLDKNATVSQFRSINEQNVAGQVKNPEGEGTVPRLDIANRTLWHSLDHYGQMVEYLRMNGINPQAIPR